MGGKKAICLLPGTKYTKYREKRKITFNAIFLKISLENFINFRENAN